MVVLRICKLLSSHHNTLGCLTDARVTLNKNAVLAVEKTYVTTARNSE